jgi:hypothetical protein
MARRFRPGHGNAERPACLISPQEMAAKLLVENFGYTGLETQEMNDPLSDTT